MLKACGSEVSLIKFSTHNRLFRDILRTLLRASTSDELFVLDISGNRDAIRAASLYSRVLWIDHHVWSPELQPDNVEFLIDSTQRSATSIVSRYLSVFDFSSLADEIDVNEVRSEEGEKLRRLIAGIRFKFRGNFMERKLSQLSRDIANEGIEVIERDDYRGIREEFERYAVKSLENLTVRVLEKEGKRISVVFPENPVPTFMVLEELKRKSEEPIDIIAIVYLNKNGARVEFRTQTEENVLEIAKKFGGGGHLKASGANVSSERMEELLRDLGILTESSFERSYCEESPEESEKRSKSISENYSEPHAHESEREKTD
jgi:oligoribonuclease NrnB/cAMP/cGMP phosphodiesterase (DHH superfamily)